MTADQQPEFPRGTPDERELFLRWLGFLRGAVVRKIDGLDDEQARWTPGGSLLSLLGIVEAFRRAQIAASAAFDFTPYLITALFFLVLTVPLARLTDWLVDRDRRQRYAQVGAR